MTTKKEDITKRGPGRPPLPPEEKARRLEERRLRQNAKYNKRRTREKEIKSEALHEYASRKNIAEGKALAKLGKGKKNKGGQRQGAGRPKGSRVIYSYESVKKLEALGFDPIERQVELFGLILNQLNEIDPKTGMPRIKVGSMAHATMLGHMKSINDSLARYSYRAVPEKKEIDFGDKSPTIIKLMPIAKKTETGEGLKEDDTSDDGDSEQ